MKRNIPLDYLFYGSILALIVDTFKFFNYQQFVLGSIYPTIESLFIIFYIHVWLLTIIIEQLFIITNTWPSPIGGSGPTYFFGIVIDPEQLSALIGVISAMFWLLVITSMRIRRRNPSL